MNVKVFPFNPLQENTYLIWDETGEAAVIDADMLFDKEKERIKRFIEENQLTLIRVINTHLHFDHQFGNKFLHETYGIMPDAGAEDEFLLDSAHLVAKNWGIPYSESVQRPGNYITDNQIIEGEIHLNDLQKYSKIRIFNAMIEFGEVENDISCIHQIVKRSPSNTN